MPLTLPNVLTLLRLFAAPGVALVFVLLPRPAADGAAFALFALASITDWFDGWIARKFNQMSEFGRMLDPIADKAMVTIALAVILMLSGPDPWLIIPAAAIFLREVAVSGLREHLAGRVSIPVTRLAKWKTTAQMVAIAALLLTIYSDLLGLIGVGLLWVAAALTAITGWDYFRRGLASPAMQEPEMQEDG